jgi:hypothetical protein
MAHQIKVRQAEGTIENPTILTHYPPQIEFETNNEAEAAQEFERVKARLQRQGADIHTVDEEEFYLITSSNRIEHQYTLTHAPTI